MPYVCPAAFHVLLSAYMASYRPSRCYLWFCIGRVVSYVPSLQEGRRRFFLKGEILKCTYERSRRNLLRNGCGRSARMQTSLLAYLSRGGVSKQRASDRGDRVLGGTVLLASGTVLITTHLCLLNCCQIITELRCNFLRHKTLQSLHPYFPTFPL